MPNHMINGFYRRRSIEVIRCRRYDADGTTLERDLLALIGLMVLGSPERLLL